MNLYKYENIIYCKSNGYKPHTWINSQPVDEKTGDSISGPMTCKHCNKTYTDHQKEIQDYIDNYKPESTLKGDNHNNNE